MGKNITVILTPQPKSAFGQVLAAMYPPVEVEPGIADTAVIAHDARVADSARIEGGASIGAGAEIGDGAWIKANVAIGDGCVIGAGTMVEENAALSHAMIGKNCQIGPGVRIGFIGFGVGRDGGGNALVRHLGRVLIGDACTIGANTTIDRGFLEDTVIGAHVMIDNLVQIAHNCTIGDGNVICGQVGIAGSTVIGDNNIFGAQSGVADHITIGSGNVFAARAGVTKSTGDGQVMAGFPAVPAQDFRRQVASLRRLATPRKTT
ncbi:MAG: UDP-3-O-(3-hydroxymyristoyl)glucosamine N-acyltransferase [Alphaproteobacteria bacterium]|nr:UDP-3-O-(3-hydroxymyristoyl)glucosamine N-acyltransferase [Alphaproteobacteria bacterium]